MTTRFSVGILAVLLASFLSASGALGYVPEMAMHDRRPGVHPLIVTGQTDIIGTWELIRVSGDIGQSDSYAFNADGSFMRTVLTRIEGSCEKVFRRTVTGTFTATSDTVTIAETADATTTTRDECSPENEGKVTNGTLETLVRSWQVGEEAGKRILHLGDDIYTEAEAVGANYKVYVPLIQR